MIAKILVDTNVLVYAYDRSEPEKQAKALEVLDKLAINGVGVISAQVLAEFFNTVTHRLTAPLSVTQAIERLENYLQSWIVLDITGLVALEAARGVRDHSFSFWEAQIWAAAHLNQIPVVFSEDFSPGTVVEGVRFIDPFSGRFNLRDWIS